MKEKEDFSVFFFRGRGADEQIFKPERRAPVVHLICPSPFDMSSEPPASLPLCSLFFFFFSSCCRKSERLEIRSARSLIGLIVAWRPKKGFAPSLQHDAPLFLRSTHTTVFQERSKSSSNISKPSSGKPRAVALAVCFFFFFLFFPFFFFFFFFLPRCFLS